MLIPLRILLGQEVVNGAAHNHVPPHRIPLGHLGRGRGRAPQRSERRLRRATWKTTGRVLRDRTSCLSIVLVAGVGGSLKDIVVALAVDDFVGVVMAFAPACGLGDTVGVVFVVRVEVVGG